MLQERKYLLSMRYENGVNEDTYSFCCLCFSRRRTEEYSLSKFSGIIIQRIEVLQVDAVNHFLQTQAARRTIPRSRCSKKAAIRLSGNSSIWPRICLEERNVRNSQEKLSSRRATNSHFLPFNFSPLPDLVRRPASFILSKSKIAEKITPYRQLLQILVLVGEVFALWFSSGSILLRHRPIRRHFCPCLGLLFSSQKTE